MPQKPLQVTVYSDYLCPWCFNSQIRLKQIQVQWQERIKLEWKSFMLVPEIKQQTIEAFQAYSHKWDAIGKGSHTGEFRVWSAGKTPPNHSLPALAAAKVAQSFGEEAFFSYQDRLMESYFRDHLNIAETEVLMDLAQQSGMDAALFEERFRDSQWEALVWEEHRNALDIGITSIPTVVINEQEALVGALSVSEYETAFQKHCQ